MHSNPVSGRTRFSKSLAPAALTALVAAALVGLVSFASPASAAGTLVPLGAADSFAVLGGSTVTNTGPTVIVGDLGVSPGTAITGFPPGFVAGDIHGGDTAALQAHADSTTAYNAAADQTPDVGVGLDLGGLTLTPGVFNAPGATGITGNLTLDAQGDPNAVFIFQFQTTLSTAASSTVTLINGAQPCNVFWQVSSSATLGANSTFVGSIIAAASIDAQPLATVTGRLLTLSGAITLDTNLVTAPTCAPVATVPDAPVTVTATAGDATAVISFAAPAADGGSLITGYNVFAGTTAGGESATPINSAPLDPSATSFTATGLTNGTPYFFTVVAINAIGASDPSAEVTATPAAAARVPSAPLQVTATQTGPGELTVTWMPPADPGSSPVTSYDVGYGNSEMGEGGTVPEIARSVIFDGLSDGEYTAVVYATNDAGSGPGTMVDFEIVTSVTITPDDGDAAAPVTGTLANTGTPTTPLLIVAVIALLAGTGISFAGRRRRDCTQ